MVLFFWLNVWYSKTILRKGTETQSPLSDAWGLQLQFIPARGRKHAEHTAGPLLHQIAIYPRKGTETCHPLRPYSRKDIVIYPRKGTEAYLHLLLFQSLQLQFIPARGRKLEMLADKISRLPLQFIPARGQKSTSATGVCQQRRCFAFSYILFYRLGTAPAGIVFVTGSALTPCGTFRFRGRIFCR